MENLLAIWGAVLSTGLCLIKIYELWNSRFQVLATYSLSGDPDEGNDIIIENPSDKTLLIGYWELFWRKQHNFRKLDKPVEFPDEGYCNITIKPHSRHTINFAGIHHFEWGHSTISNGRLYINLHISGRSKPLSLLVYDPSHSYK